MHNGLIKQGAAELKRIIIQQFNESMKILFLTSTETIDQESQLTTHGEREWERERRDTQWSLIIIVKSSFWWSDFLANFSSAVRLITNVSQRLVRVVIMSFLFVCLSAVAAAGCALLF